MRKYSEAWEELRDKMRLEIVAPRAWHKRIHKGIRNERYKDLVHSMQLAEKGLIDRVTYTRRGDTMIYNLIRRDKDNSIKLDELF